ncbi:MAG: hypothetical protein MJ139_06995, partial [Limosilactobacillus sp.]|nr:hypothetical protein [Limosilactobacillus sp.]
TPMVDSVNPIKTSEYTEGQPAAYVKGGNWEIVSADMATAVEMSQGNQNPSLMSAKRGGLSDDKGSKDMTYYANFVNNRDKALVNARYYINLPQASDPATVNPTPSAADGLGSTKPEKSFTFKLTGPVKINTQDTDVEIFYSTKTFVGKDDSNVASDYVTADQVTDWSQIKSVLVKKGSIAPYAALGRITLAGIDPTLAEDAGKTGYLTSVLISDSMEPFTISRDDNQKSMSKIHVFGTSTITTRYHYVDKNGADQYIQIPTLTHTYNDMEDTLPHDDFRLKDAEKQLIPAGYKLVVSTDGKLVPGSEEDPTVMKGETKYKWDDQVKPAMDGTIVTYELV